MACGITWAIYRRSISPVFLPLQQTLTILRTAFGSSCFNVGVVFLCRLTLVLIAKPSDPAIYDRAGRRVDLFLQLLRFSSPHPIRPSVLSVVSGSVHLPCRLANGLFDLHLACLKLGSRRHRRHRRQPLSCLAWSTATKVATVATFCTLWP